MAEIKIQAHERMDKLYREKYKLSLLDVCKKLGYSEQNIEIVACCPSDAEAKKKLYLKYRQLFDAFCKTDVGRKIVGETRTVLDYFKDLIAGWTGEDLFLRALKKYRIDARADNTDKARRILMPNEPTCRADIITNINGNERHIELMQECCGYLTGSNYSENRRGKFDEMHRSGSVFVDRDLKNNKYVIIDFASEDVKFHRMRHEKWDKIVDRYYLEENGKKLRDMKLLWPELIVVLAKVISDERSKFEMVDETVSNQPTKPVASQTQVKDELVQKKVVEKTKESVVRNPKPAVAKLKQQPPPPPPPPPAQKEEMQSDDSDVEIDDPTYGWA